MSTIRALTMPKWGIEMQEGTVTGWHKALGDQVAEGEELIDIETDKIVNTVESPFAGVLRRMLVDESDVKKVGELIGVIASDADDDAAIDAFIANFKAADTSFEPESDTTEEPAADGDTTSEAAAPAETAPAPAAELKISPIARRVAGQLGVDLSGVVGTGRNGRISKEDVENAARAQGMLADEAEDEAAALWETVRLTGVQKTAAARLQAAKQEIPHFYLEVDVVAKKLLKAADRAAVSVNTAILKALGMALEAVPEANVQYHDDGMRRCSRVDVGMAVATARGLVVPIVRDVARASLSDLDAAARDLADRARSRKLSAEDLEGGTATLSNLGMMGIDRFTAIVNPPHASILAVGSAVKRAVVDDDGDLKVRPVLSATLSCDHRAIDGALGARVLAAFRKAVESGLEKVE